MAKLTNKPLKNVYLMDIKLYTLAYSLAISHGSAFPLLPW